MNLKNKTVVSKVTNKTGIIKRCFLDELHISFDSGDSIIIYLYNYKDLIEVDPDIEIYLDEKLRMLLAT